MQPTRSADPQTEPHAGFRSPHAELLAGMAEHWINLGFDLNAFWSATMADYLRLTDAAEVARREKRKAKEDLNEVLAKALARMFAR